jgi:6-phosphofructokinase 1
MNNVIRELVATLWDTYGVRTIYGIERGYWGFHVPDVVGPDAGGKGSNLSCPKTGPVLLTPSTVADIHHYGGTMLGSDRGGDDADLAVRFLRHYGVSHLYVIGGDGTHRGADQIFRKTQEAGVPIVVCGLPKTIDNDVGIIDRRCAAAACLAACLLAGLRGLRGLGGNTLLRRQ